MTERCGLATNHGQLTLDQTNTLQSQITAVHQHMMDLFRKNQAERHNRALNPDQVQTLMGELATIEKQIP